jgi:hypothetical protein
VIASVQPEAIVPASRLASWMAWTVVPKRTHAIQGVARLNDVNPATAH